MARKLPELLETRVVTQTTLEFDYEHAHPYRDGVSRLRVTLDATGLTVKSVWEAAEPEWSARWEDLQAVARSRREAERRAECAREEHEIARAIRQEAECVVVPLRHRRRAACAASADVARPVWPAPGEIVPCDPEGLALAWGVR